MLALLLTAVVAAAPSEEAGALEIAAPGLSGVGIDAQTLEFLNAHLATRLAEAGAQVLTARDVSAVLDMERSRQLLGCSDDESASCLIEIGQALGADAILVGELARLEQNLHANVRLVSASDAQVLARWTKAAPTLEALMRAFDGAARELAQAASGATGRALAPSRTQRVTPAAHGPALWRYAPGAVGLAAAGVGGYAFTRAAGHHEDLRTAQTLTAADARALRDDGKRWQTLGWAGVGAGVLGLGVSALLVSTAPASEGSPQIATVPLRGGAAISFSGVLP